MIEGYEVSSCAGAVATGPPAAARVGAGVIEAGGNAMDATAAACLACAVLEPQSVDIGGYVCCAVILETKTGTVWSLDANSVAPRSAHERMFQVTTPAPGKAGINENEYTCSVRDDANVYGPLAVGTPGFMAGVGLLWERWGRLGWREIVEPSLKLLEEGFPYGSTADAIATKAEAIQRFDATARHLMPNGRILKAEDIWHPADLGKTLERVATAGWRDFYEGEIGRKIADYVSSLGGALSREDMAEFQPRVTEAYRVTYRGATVFGPTLPNGALTSLEALNMLECFEPMPDGQLDYWHRLAEILKLAWRDRLRYLGDPDYVDVPLERLLNKNYAAGRVETLRQFPDYVDRLQPQMPEVSPHGTVQVSAADASGNLVAATISQGGLFGSCLMVPDTGIILGHGMCRFDPHPGRPNSAGSRKRPLNNVAPMILRMPDRDFALGARGGRRIVSVSVQLAQRVVDYGQGCREVTVAPRMHVLDSEPLEFAKSTQLSAISQLKRLGHKVRRVPEVAGAAHCAEIVKGQGSVKAGGNTWAAGAEAKNP